MPFAKDRRRLVPNSVHVENGAKKNGLRHAIFTVSQNKYVGDWKEDFKDGMLEKMCLLMQKFIVL